MRKLTERRRGSVARRRSRASSSALAGTLIAAALIMAACSSNSPGSSSSGTSAPAGKLQQVIDRGVLNAGACLTSPPYGSLNASGKPEGFDIDVLTQLADYIGVKVNIIEVTPAGRVPGVQSGQLDVGACTFSITPERQKQIWFSNPVMATGIGLTVLKNSPITRIEDTAGKKIAIATGSNYIPIIKGLVPTAKIKTFDTPADLFVALSQHQVDAVAEQNLTSGIAVTHNPKLVVVDQWVGGQQIFQGLGIAKGNQALLDKVNDFLAQFHSSGADKKLFTKWIPGVDVGKTFDSLTPTKNIP
jgi:polar amino acid transport system substrate-binding protein